MDTSVSRNVVEALSYIEGQIPAELQSPAVAIICGSGLGGLSDAVLAHPKCEIDYKNIPHFPEGKGGWD